MPWNRRQAAHQRWLDDAQRSNPGPPPPWEGIARGHHYVHVTLTGGADSSVDVVKQTLVRLDGVKDCDIWKSMTGRVELFVTRFAGWDREATDTLCITVLEELTRLAQEYRDLQFNEPTVETRQ